MKYFSISDKYRVHYYILILISNYFQTNVMMLKYTVTKHEV